MRSHRLQSKNNRAADNSRESIWFTNEKYTIQFSQSTN